jgi:uncharacterized protein YkwD
MSSWLRVLRTTLPAGPRLVAIATLGVVLAGALLMAPEGIFSDPVPSTLGRDSPCWRYKRSERRFTTRMNKVRGRKGRGRLSLDPELSRAARVHTSEMIRRRTLYHTSNAKLRRRIVGWSTLGENVGVGGSVRSLHKAFMRSRYHRSNVLYSRFRHTGVGVRKKGGRMWVTVIFEARRDPGTRLRMPRC